MKKLISILLVAGWVLLAQEAAPVAQKLVPIKNVDVSRLHNLLGVYDAGGRVKWRAAAGFVALSGPKDLVEAMEEFIRKIDVPMKNVELTFYVLLGTSDGKSATLPSELTGVAKQLTSLFGYKGIRLLETAILRGREEESGSASGLMMPSSDDLPVSAKSTYSLEYRSVSVSGEGKDRTVRLDQLRFYARIPTVTAPVQPAPGTGASTQLHFVDTGLKTNIDVREGQKVVVGKAGIDGSPNSMFLVVSAKVVE